MSETALIRSEVTKFCKGKGLDIGCGGDKVTHDSWGFDLPMPYTKVGNDVIELRGDARNLPINDCALDYIYSSHLLEDFRDTEDILKEWIRTLKRGGLIILYLPDEQKYRMHCQKTGQSYNESHKVDNMSYDYMQEILSGLGLQIVKSIPEHSHYSFLIVGMK